MRRINKRTTLLSSGDLFSTECGMNIFFQICNHIDIRVCNIARELGLEEFEIITRTTNELLVDENLECLYDVDK